MFKRICFLMIIGLVMATMPYAALAQGPITPQHTDPGWQAWYWNNTTLSGPPVLQRYETHLDYNWGTGSPAPGVNADRFSARWTRYIDVTPGEYSVSVTADDGIRLWVDDELLINQWQDQAPTTYVAQKYLGLGHHLVRVEYYENGGGAVAKVLWAQAPQPVGGWRGEYYNNKSLSGYPALVRDDQEINFFWGGGSPAPGQVGANGFSVRWSRTFALTSGNYRFTMTVDDGARLFVNGHLLIDAWRDQSPTVHFGDIYLPGGSVTVQMEYYENTGGAVAQLVWGPPDDPPPPPPPPPPTNAVIVDDTDPGFVTGGLARGWRTARTGYGGQTTWTRNNYRRRPYYNWGRWYPTLDSGWYEVFVYIPSRYANTTQARYWVASNTGFTLRVVDQSRYSDQWVSLGTYRFRGTSGDLIPNEYVSLADITYEPFLSRYIAFDAVKWEPR